MAQTSSNESIYLLHWKSKADPEAHEWPLVETSHALSVFCIYLALVLYALPSYMRDRKPYGLQKLILVYNFAHILLSMFLIYKALVPGLPVRDLLSPVCHYQVNSNREHQLSIAGGIWWYMIAKVLELPETLFFILRKKNNQVTFLHVYHHASTFLYSWFFLKVAPEENCLFIICANSFIHVIMYTYYTLAAMGPEYKKYIWWKKYMTSMQIVQFFVMETYLVTGYFFSSCQYTPATSYLLMGNVVCMIYLFTKFYISQYFKDRKNKDN